ncbi:2-hydroxychromene-2-carboxylate isomerase [Allosphingosinicella sp.]|uniref:2-hydroxychromene-2-carboxylate isomerase n=1 Tax=Allosphingosinicella sp. TaxID=2823234 RepID=UPI003784451C
MDEPVFYFDFGSLNAYLAWRLLPGIEQRTGARFEQVPVLLGGIFKATGNRSPVEAYAGIPAKLAYEFREIDRFVARHGIDEFNMNPHFPVNTLMLMRGAVAAEAMELQEAYVAAIFHFMWEDPRKLDDPHVLEAALEEAGLPAEELIELAGDQNVKDELIANTREAVEQGVFGLPSFIVGGELFFGKDRLRDVEEAILGG